MAKKPRNRSAQDVTLINLRAMNKRQARDIRELQGWLHELENNVRMLRKRVDRLQGK